MANRGTGTTPLTRAQHHALYLLKLARKSDMSGAKESLFSVGKRVYLVGDHPWSGASGVIVGKWLGSPNLGLDWEVRLDAGDYDGHEVAAGERDLRLERRVRRA